MVVDLICGVGSQTFARIEFFLLLGTIFSFVGTFLAYTFKWIKKFGIKQNLLTEFLLAITLIMLFFQAFICPI